VHNVVWGVSDRPVHESPRQLLRRPSTQRMKDLLEVNLVDSRHHPTRQHGDVVEDVDLARLAGRTSEPKREA
ncbi:hypothetical protein, partial [Streptomyces sp. DSM 41534]